MYIICPHRLVDSVSSYLGGYQCVPYNTDQLYSTSKSRSLFKAGEAVLRLIGMKKLHFAGVTVETREGSIALYYDAYVCVLVFYSIMQ